MPHQAEASNFASRIEKTLEKVQYRRADSAEEKAAIYRLRYESYIREGTLAPNPLGIFTDPGDETFNAWLIGVYIEGELASSIRLHIGSALHHYLSAAEAFPHLVKPRLARGEMFLDASRQTSRLEFTRAYPFLPLITMRSGFVAMQYFGADYLSGTVRLEYQPAFRRMFGSVTWGEPGAFPPLSRPHALMVYDCKTKWAQTKARYPFMVATPQEQRALFHRSSASTGDPYAELTARRGTGAGNGRQHSAACVA